MVMTDPVADMLTRIRSGLERKCEYVDMPLSGLKQGIAEVLKREGYVGDFSVVETKPAHALRVFLKYGPEGEDVIQSLKRVSRPGRRVYARVSDMEPVLDGLGITVVSTPKGVLSDRECRKERVGGELLCEVY